MPRGRPIVSAPEGRVYSSPALQHQIKFPRLRQSVRLRDDGNSARKPKQETLTQMDWVSMTPNDREEDEIEDDEDDDYEEREKARKRKRRRTTTDLASLRKSHHTQTLTQLDFVSTRPADDFDNDEDDEPLYANDDEEEIDVQPPKSADMQDGKQGARKISGTPKAKRVLEIPSSYSPASPETPVSLRKKRLFLGRSPLADRSRNAPVLPIKSARFAPRASPAKTSGLRNERDDAGSPTASELGQREVSVDLDLEIQSPSKRPGTWTEEETVVPNPFAGVTKRKQVIEDSEAESEWESQNDLEQNIQAAESEESHNELEDVVPAVESEEPQDNPEPNVPAVTEEASPPRDEPVAHSSPAKHVNFEDKPPIIIEDNTPQRTLSPSPQASDPAELGEASALRHSSPAFETHTFESPLESQYDSQFESQRLTAQEIRDLGPRSAESDIIVSIHPQQVAKIVSRTKTHDFRSWPIPSQVKRIWIYETQPASALKYMAVLGEAKRPGEVEDLSGLGNAEFNKGQGSSKYAYEILNLYELAEHVPLSKLVEKGWYGGPMKKYEYLRPAVLEHLIANLQPSVFETAQAALEAALPPSSSIPPREPEARPTRRENVLPTDSQDAEAQLQSTIIQFTQAQNQRAEDTRRSIVRESPDLDSMVPQEDGRLVVRSSQATTVFFTQDSAAPASHRSSPPASHRSSPPASRRSSPPDDCVELIPESPSHPQTIPSSSPSLPPLQRGRSRLPDERAMPVPFSLASSQIMTKSQMLPDSIMRDSSIPPPPPVIDDSDYLSE